MIGSDILALEPVLRGGAFAGVLIVMVAAESLWPRRARVRPRARRWFANGALVAAGTLLARLLAAAPAPLSAVAAAVWADAAGFGLLHWLGFTGWPAIIAALLALDLIVWAQHWAFHHVPWLWRLHRVHHADRDLDATTALRFHPLEIALSVLIKAASVLALGAPVAAVILFEVLLNACATFNHANTSLPAPVERLVRRVLVTPDLHRIHHSTLRAEHDSNFGFCLSVWDRLSGLLRESAAGGDRAMTIGLADTQDSRPEQLSWSFLAPFQPGAREQDKGSGP